MTVTGTVYRATTIDDAQRVVDSHPVGLDGLCVACRVDGCADRAAALWRLGQEMRLPRRRPGATRPEFVGARRVA